MTGHVETLRLDAGDPYLWRVGDVAVLTQLKVAPTTDDVRVTMTLTLETDGAEAVARRTGLLSVGRWTLVWDILPKEKPLPAPLTNDHLTSLLTKHREEVQWRAGKLLSARDRQQWQAQDLSDLKPGMMVPYRRLFPADFDLVWHLDGKAYYFADYHCVEPNCQCAAVTISVLALDDEGDDHQDIGSATIDLLSPRLAPSGSRAAVAVVRKVMRETVMQKRIAQRYAECRGIAHALARHLRRLPEPVTTTKVGRNSPCPCGSGKKYKKCCLRA